MNLRIRELRKTLHLTLEEFGKRLGVTKTAISTIENGKRNVTEQMFLAICRTYGVNPDWLRSGSGSMFLSASLDEKYKNAANAIASGTSDLDRIIRQTLIYYYEMDDDSKSTLMSYIKNVAALVPIKEALHSEAPEQTHLNKNFVIEDANGDAG